MSLPLDRAVCQASSEQSATAQPGFQPLLALGLDAVMQDMTCTNFHDIPAIGNEP